MSLPFGENDMADRRRQIMGPQVDAGFWQRVKAVGKRPPVSGIPPEVADLLALRANAVGVVVEDSRYIYL